jgi:predicted nucleic acid-binding protein
MPKKKKEAAIIDANILIDYASVDEDLIREIVIYWKKVFVPDVILHEVSYFS